MKRFGCLGCLRSAGFSVDISAMFTYCSNDVRERLIMNVVFNARIQHTASWFNTLATALIAAGAFAPAAALVYGLSAPVITTGYVVLLVLVCVSVGVALHFAGRLLLGRLRE
jgi:hypothetical protein